MGYRKINFIRALGLYILMLCLPSDCVSANEDSLPINVKSPEPVHVVEEKSKTLLSRLYGPMDFLRLGKTFGGYTCTVPPVLKYNELSLITLNGMISSMTTVLVGYGANETSETFRANKGYVYGVGVKRDFSPKTKHQFGFTVDYTPPKKTMWKSEEFCVLVFSPALKMGPSLTGTLGKSYNDPRRYLGSTEKIVSTLLQESTSTKSRLMTQCCFIMATEP